MQKRTLPRRALAGAGWAHPYGYGPFSPFLYADGGDGGGSGSGGDAGGDGGSGGDAGAGGDGGGAGTGANSGGGTDGGSGTGNGQGDGGKGKDAGEDDAAKIKRLERELHAARSEAGKARTDAKKQAADDAVNALTQQLGKALGFVKDDTPPDPKALADAIAQKDSTIAARDASLRAKDVELSVWARADKLNARAGALLDSRSFVAALADLDPTAKGFTTALDQAIKDAVKENPSFAAAAAAGKSGGDLSGGTGEGAAKKRTGSLAGAITDHYQT